MSVSFKQSLSFNTLDAVEPTLDVVAAAEGLHTQTAGHVCVSPTIIR